MYRSLTVAARFYLLSLLLMDHVTIVCFLASYAASLALELLYQFRPLPLVRWLALTFGAAGLTAQTIFLAVQQPPLIWQYGWMLFLAWILAIFYLVGSVHHRRLSWGLFVLPLVLGLVGLGAAFGRPHPPLSSPRPGGDMGGTTDNTMPILSAWGMVHGWLLLLAAVGLCVGFLASLMYLVQAHRLRAKTLPGHGVRLWSLERIEAMNRRAIVARLSANDGGNARRAVPHVSGKTVRLDRPARAWLQSFCGWRSPSSCTCVSAITCAAGRSPC